MTKNTPGNLFWRNARLTGLVGMAGMLLGAVAPSRADVVAEWKFVGAANPAGPAIVTLDTAAPGASTQSKVLSASQVVPGPTGLSAPWASFLQSGYLDVPSGGGASNKDKYGLVTQDNPAGTKNGQFRKYLGYSGLQADKAGSVCLVFSPQSGWLPPVRRGLFSSGHIIDGTISLGLQKNGQMVFRVGGKKTKYVDAGITRKWEMGKWYFIGASWEGDKKTLLVIYELGADLKTTLAKADTVQSSESCPICDQPRIDPLVVGATWINTGGEAYTADGADAHIAYVRVDNTFADQDSFKTILTGLAAASAPVPASSPKP
jgi:hypothetical protein